MHKLIGFLFFAVLLGGFAATLVALYPGPMDPEGDTSPVVVILDSDVPGTKVFRGADELGVVPVNVTQAKLDALGLGDVAVDPVHPLHLNSLSGALYVGEDDKLEARFALQVPDAVADRYKAVETEWGRRTAYESGAGPPRPTGREIPQMRVKFAPATTVDGLRFRMEAPDRVNADRPTYVVKLTAENVGTKPIAGTMPHVILMVGAVKDSWRTQAQMEPIPLPASWEKIAPGQTVKANIELATPDQSGDYHLKGVLSLRASPAENRKGTSASSNVELVQVK